MYAIYTNSLLEAKEVIRNVKEKLQKDLEVIYAHEKEDIKKVRQKFLEGKEFIAVLPQNAHELYLKELYRANTFLEKEVLKEIENGNYDILKEKYLLKFRKVKISLKDVIGMEALKEEVKILKKFIDSYFIKPFLLVGLPGVGKSYVVKAIAGELKVPLVDLDLKSMLFRDNPIEVLEQAFFILKKISESIALVVLMDEIEKAFYSLSSNEYKFMGTLMTILNDLNDSEEYKLKGFLFATANNIKVISEKEPAFLRRGRFSEIYFVGGIKVKTAIEMMKYYLQKYFKEKESTLEKLSKLIVEIALDEHIDKITSRINLERDTFVYLPSEIAELARRIKIESIKGKLTKEILRNIVKDTIPIYLSLEDEIRTLLSTSERFKKLT